MKKLLLLTVLLAFAGCANADTLPPLNTVLSTAPSSTPLVYDVDGLPNANAEAAKDIAAKVNATASGVYEATYVPNLGENMIPQNAAAKGEPIPAKRQKLINIRTKQRSQGNDYWNPGGKGHQTYFE